MSTFIGQLVGFALIVFLLWKYVVPPVRNMMKTRQETVRTQLEDSAEATKKLAEAEAEHKKALEEAKAETAKVLEEARFDAEKIAEQLRAQADSEVERIKVQGAQQVELLRQQLIRELRAEPRYRISQPRRRTGSRARLRSGSGSRPPSTASSTNSTRWHRRRRSSRMPTTAKLRSASRESLAAAGRAVRRGDRRPQRRRIVQARRRSRVGGQAAVRRDGAEQAPGRARRERRNRRPGMLEALLSGKVGDDALEILKTAVSQRWSAESDLAEAVQHVARLALLVRAERDDEVEEVEDQLFRFSRILDSQPKLNTLLSDYTTPAEGRIGLLDNVLERQGQRHGRRHFWRRRSSCCTAGTRTRPSWNWPNSRWPVAGRSSRTSAPPPISATHSATGSPRCSAASTATRCRSSYT